MLSEALINLILLNIHNIVLNFVCMCNDLICARLSDDIFSFHYYRKTNSHLEKTTWLQLVTSL